MKASTFSDAQKAFILKQGADGVPVSEMVLSGKPRQVEGRPTRPEIRQPPTPNRKPSRRGSDEGWVCGSNAAGC